MASTCYCSILIVIATITNVSITRIISIISIIRIIRMVIVVLLLVVVLLLFKGRIGFQFSFGADDAEDTGQGLGWFRV